MFVLLAFVACALAQSALTFTGDVEKDFQGKPGVVTVIDLLDMNGQPQPDVGLPPGAAWVNRLSGWDMKSVSVLYDFQNNALHIGINCFGICGDADGDGDPDRTSMALSSLGGIDSVDFAKKETFAFAMDFGSELDPAITGDFDFIIGYPADNPNPGAALPCGVGKTMDADYFSAKACFGLYVAQSSLTVGSNLGTSFIYDAALAHPAIDHNPVPSMAKPDLEWTVSDLSGLRAKANLPMVDSRGIEPWSMGFRAFAGSFQDAGIGEDSIPNNMLFTTIQFPCQVFDKCDVCGGDDTSCLDCKGNPNGPAIYDACDVCGGDDSTCVDCKGDPNGPAIYDECDVCGGDTSTCLDCKRMPNGAAVYDLCDVCGGDSTTCLDCKRVPNGAAVYDLCDICGGDSSTCLDCLKVPNGPHVYDVCDVCNGDGTSCFDCAGVPLGTCEYDVCDVCCGDGTTCLDCNDTPFGTCKYDNCGVCCGDGSSCVCLKIHCVPTVEVDHALLEWSLVATIDRIEHTVDVLEGIKEELCRYDVNRGNLASDIAGYLSTANEFRDILDNFVYVQIWFKDTIDEALQTI